jgi:hypothetical protein
LVRLRHRRRRRRAGAAVVLGAARGHRMLLPIRTVRSHLQIERGQGLPIEALSGLRSAFWRERRRR